MVLAFDGLRVKKAISRERGEFELVCQDHKYSLWRDGSVFLETVEIKPVIFHAPEQAFFNLTTTASTAAPSARLLSRRRA
jgi:hypothetical protein